MGRVLAELQDLPTRTTVQEAEHQDQGRRHRERHAVTHPATRSRGGTDPGANRFRSLGDGSPDEALAQLAAEVLAGRRELQLAHGAASRALALVQVEMVFGVVSSGAHSNVFLRRSPNALSAREYRFRIAA